MKIRKILAMLLVLALVCALLPATALAAGASNVTVNGVTLAPGQYLVNGASTATTVAPTGDTGYAYFTSDATTSTLTLHNYNGGRINAAGALTISLDGNNTISSGSYPSVTLSAGDLTIKGPGKLSASAMGTCISAINSVDADIIITDRATVEANSRASGSGMYARTNVTISSNSTVTSSGRVVGIGVDKGNVAVNDSTVTAMAPINAGSGSYYGIKANSSSGTITLNNSTVKAIGATSAMNIAPTLTYDSNSYSWKTESTTADSGGVFTDSSASPYSYSDAHKLFGIVPGGSSGISSQVTYDDNGATSPHVGGDNSYTVSTTSFTLPATAPSKNNYSFTGWKVTKPALFGRGFALNNVYTSGSTSLNNAYGDVTLTAQWAPLPTQLDAPTGLAWGSGTAAKTASWSAASNASSYLVQLYKDGTAAANKIDVESSASALSHSFDSIIPENGTGTYYFAVKAVGDGTSYSNSDWTTSGGYDYTAPPAVTAVAFSGLTANGSDTASTTELTLTFDKDVTGLAAGDITVNGASKGALTKESGTGVYKLAISDITAENNGTVNVAVSKTGFAFTPANKNVTVKKITVDPPAGGYAPPAPVTVYNDTNIQNATIRLTGSGLSADDLLITKRLSSGSDYNAMLRLADKGDVFRVYNITLKSGKSSTGSAMYLSFDLAERYAGKAFTLAHKKADGTYEYFYATADGDGDLTFGPFYSLSPFMLVKGTLARDSVGAPKMGDSATPGLWIGLCIAGLLTIGLAYGIKKRKQVRK